MNVDVNAVINWMQAQRLVLGGSNVTIGFRDRAQELMNFINDLSIGGVRVIYGPLGAGKTTLLSLLAKALRVVNADIAVIYVNYERKVTDVIMPEPLSVSGLVNELVSKVMASIMGVTVGVGQVIELAKALWSYVRELRGINDVLVIHDDLDRWFISSGIGRNAVQELIAMYAGEFEGRPLGESPWGGKYVKVIISVSDQLAVELAWRYRGKGGLMPMLLWNLPHDPFLEVINEVRAQLPSGPAIDPEVLWRLLGGNVRALADLAINYGWDVASWLDGVIRHVRDLIYRETQLLNLPDAQSLIARVRSRVEDPRPDDLVYDALMAREPLIEDNVLMHILGRPLAQLPSEDWVGNDYAYQLPAYYWVLKAMIGKESMMITGTDVVNELMRNLRR